MDTPIAPELAIRRVRLEELHHDPANARRHGDENMDAIKASLARFGQAEPLVVQAGSLRVIGGNGRMTAMRALGWEECDIVELDLPETEATALGIALNRAGELAEWNDGALASLLESLRAEGELDGVGFDEAAVDALLEELASAEPPLEVDDPGPQPLPEEPVSREGDVWTLGDHRLVCGDSREEDSFRAVLLADHAALVWTDPPYGVSYVGGTKDALSIKNDELVGDELRGLLAEALGNAALACRPGAVWYVAAPAGPNFLPFAQVLTDLEVWRQTLVWAKNALVLGRSDYHYRHEAIFYGWVPGAAHQAPPNRNQDTIWECPRPSSSPDHPTMKPVALVKRAIENSSERGGIVLDPFSGSGTTILASEATGRRARAIELDPRYCDAAIRRWEEATGKQAMLGSDSFEAVAEARRGR